jgi:hypothetical protein
MKLTDKKRNELINEKEELEKLITRPLSKSQATCLRDLVQEWKGRLAEILAILEHDPLPARSEHLSIN